MGVGSTLHFTDLSEPTLLAALEPMLANGPRQRAAELGLELRAENASTQTADAFEQAVVGAHPAPTRPQQFSD
jgi:sterol 3beta-glucosyltransferase